jgi:hypothetical protein
MQAPDSVRTQGRRSLFWPIALITFGVLVLLSNLGMIPATGWAILWRFWPVALVALGVDVLIGRRSVAGAIASGVLLLVLVGLAIGIAVFAEQIPFLVEWLKPAALHVEHIAYPLDGIERATIAIDWTSAPGFVSALMDAQNLIEADVAYRGELTFDAQRSGNEAAITLNTYLQGISYSSFDFDDSDARWDIRLSPDVSLELRFDTGTGSAEFDLGELELSRLQLDAGTGAVDLVLPTRSSFQGEINGSSGALTLHRSPEVGLRVVLDAGSGHFDPGEHLTLVSGEPDGDGIWETEGYDRADYRITLNIDQGSGILRIQ